MRCLLALGAPQSSRGRTQAWFYCFWRYAKTYRVASQRNPYCDSNSMGRLRQRPSVPSSDRTAHVLRQTSQHGTAAAARGIVVAGMLSMRE